MSVDGTAPEADEFWLFGYGSLIWKPPPHFDRRIPGWVTGYVRRFWQDHRGTPEAPGRVVTLISRSYWEQLTDHHDSAPDRVWGVAYRIKPDRVAEVKEYLDIREINGYTIHYTPFHPAPAPDGLTQHHRRDHRHPIRTLVYIGTPDNDQFVGPQDPQELAEHIYRSAGPSGPNRDYLWGLEAALDELSPESGDEHVTDLSNRLRAVAAREEEKKKEEEEAEEGVVAAGRGEKTIPRPASPVSGVSVAVGPDQPSSVLRREQQHHEQHHDFRKVSSIDEQEETEKTS
ncbi:ChaC-like protein-domain-containing protein [Parachaetomium inaequale]|uniref:glutathione-specific gamma-glutamylcyclotransferase n=1 Tax=Parachaetomium inaequale TaxID=2588326 RepID=A0AAN6PJY5_9PEZI|nr:ChaC-like protein-domain-containing protein [Parachaetomium inaequale]